MTGKASNYNLPWRPGRLLVNTMHVGGWSMLRIVLQAGSLILLTHAFGVKTYGVLAGATSLYITLAQFVGLGTGTALLRHVSQQREAHARMRATQNTYLLTGLAALLVAWPISVLVVGNQAPPLALACLATAELMIAPALLPYSYLFQAEERLFPSGAMQTLAPIARIIAVVAALLMNVRDLGSYAFLHLATVTLVVVVTLLLVHRKPPTQAEVQSPLAAIREGLPYMISSATITASSELDKTILLRVQGSAVTGIYTAAYRVMQAATLPVNALILAAMPRLFRSTHGDAPRLTRLLLIAVLAYSVTAAVGLALLSPWLHLVLGVEFIPSEAILRAFCINVITGCVRQLITGRLTASDKQRSRNVIEIIGLCTSIALLAFLIPMFGVWGAIVALAASDIVVIFLGFRQLMAAPSVRQPADTTGEA
jgi:O-antigen/teichoic acid export membrane protein